MMNIDTHFNLKIYAPVFNLTHQYAWRGFETLDDVTHLMSSVPVDQKFISLKDGDEPFARSQGVIIAAKQALCELYCFDMLNEQKLSITKAYFLCKNIVHLSSLLSTKPQKTELLDIFKEVRKWPIQFFKNQKYLNELEEIKNDLDSFLQFAPRHYTKALALVSQEEHEKDLRVQMNMSLPYFKELKRFISSPLNIAENVIALFNTTKQHNFFGDYFSPIERLITANALQKNLDLIVKIDSKTTKILGIHTESANRMQIELSEECKKIYQSSKQLAFLCGDDHFAFKQYCNADLNKKEEFPFHHLFQATQLPLEVSDPCHLHQKVAITNLNELADFFYKSSNQFQKILSLAQEMRYQLRKLRELQSIFSTSIASLKQIH